MVRFGQERHLIKLRQLTERYGSFGIFLAAISPIPYKVFGWMAGMAEMPKRPFLIAGLIGRGCRFGFEAILIGLYGQRALDAIMWVLDNELLLAVALIAILGVVWLAYRWWDGLDADAPSHA
jgi:undecaprenyl-diphosphatase